MKNIQCELTIRGGKVNKLFEGTNVIGGAVTAFFVAILGQFWFLFVGFLAMNVIDWLTGWYAARQRGEDSSKVGAKGIFKKLWYWIVIFISFYISFSFEEMGALLGINLSFMNMLGYFVLASYLVNEIKSILENCLKLGVQLPEFLVKGLKVAGDLIDNKASATLPTNDDLLEKK